MPRQPLADLAGSSHLPAMTAREILVFVVAAAPSVVLAIVVLLWMALRVAAHLEPWPEGASAIALPLIGSVPILSVVAAIALRPRAQQARA